MSKRDRDVCADAVHQVIDLNRTAVSIDPEFIAESAMEAIGFDYELHHAGWYGCKQHMLQLARAVLRGKYDPRARVEAALSGQGEIFPETLQDRYPLRPERHPRSGEWLDSAYVQRMHLREKDRWYNIEKLGGMASSLVKHRDALEAETVALFGPRKLDKDEAA